MDSEPTYEVDFVQNTVHSENGVTSIQQYLNQVTPIKQTAKDAYESFALEVADRKLQSLKSSLFDVLNENDDDEIKNDGKKSVASKQKKTSHRSQKMPKKGKYMPIVEPISDTDENDKQPMIFSEPESIEADNIAAVAVPVGAELLGITNTPKRRVRAKKIDCPVIGCSKKFAYKRNIKRHIDQNHGQKILNEETDVIRLWQMWKRNIEY